MDYKEMRNLVGSEAEGQPAIEHSQKETMTAESRHYQQKSDASIAKASSPCKETESTDRSFPPLRSETGTDERTPITNKSRKGISSSSESVKGSEEVTVTANESSGWSLEDLEVFKHPMCLISVKTEDKEDGEEEKIYYKSEQAVFEQIKQIDLPIVIVGVVGLFKTGKSYLMNRLADSFKGGFALGNDVQPQTKGIWVWCKMHPTQKNTVLVLLDTEGLGDVDKDVQYDNNIFTLATLLCNCLVYNMNGAFSNEAVSKLTFVTEMAKNIRYRGNSSEENKMLKLILPNFVLCLRDFTLHLVKDGKPISTKQYLEDGLAEKKNKAAKFNKQRECIRNFFPKRECFVFPLPGDTSVIQNLENMSFDGLCDSFNEAIAIFVSYIYSIPPKDMSGSKPINGEMFVTLADRYVNAINHGKAADVDDAFTAAAKIRNEKIEKEALEMFKTSMLNVILPEPGNVLRRFYTKAQQAALEFLRENTVHNFQAECEYQTQKKMDELWNMIKEDNDIRVQQKCEHTLQNDPVKRSIDEKVKNKDYETAGGYRKFQRDVERLREGYFSNLRDFEEKETLWAWLGFIKSKRETEAKIVEVDENLEKKEKEDEQRRNQENIEKILKDQQKAQQEALDKQKKDLGDHYKKLNEDREKQMKAEVARYKTFLNERLEKEAAQKELERLKEEKRERKDKWFGARMWNALWNDD